MATIASCQRLQHAWFTALASATGGRSFGTHESRWVWLPARRQLMLMFPDEISAAGIRPGLAEGSRLGASSVTAWLGGSVDPAPLEAFGFHRGPQTCWMTAPVQAPQAWPGTAAAVEIQPPEVSGADAEELRVGHSQPRQAWHIAARDSARMTGRAYAFYPSGIAGLSEVGGIFSLAVGASSRRRGFGTALLSSAAAAAEAAGAKDLIVNATAPGQDLCAARGFSLVGRGRTYTMAIG
ncbi:GNAT family N-acetyltransferase [Arthrobacter caoxuetaonis]|uniref:GNAT family N-acetyltransferase n=1 Tax=Arthrobacter caoxuetaonis TaxID=2886935 RepID=A0A9X1MEC4_9MICC|nr:GNAT family N-acetyltransferase [Arthrobacter caoxuetaonis]MCC3297797.1 GNAT family N-acetyltransferase [Arthrobacter caoxuetaonis]USQ56009.1 GNAT family N-acetyltransferase [Arthrobacter caoxuetaonis]